MKQVYFLLIFLLICSNARSSAGKPILVMNPQIDISDARDIRIAASNGLKWLISKQDSAGSWCGDPAITGLVLSGFLRVNPSENIKNTVIKKGFDFTLKFVHTDGSIFKIPGLQNYTTSIVLRTLKDSKDPQYSQIIKNAEKYLLGIQFNETNGYVPDSVQYGGIGYGTLKPGARPDLSNLQLTLYGLNEEKKKEVEKPHSKEEKQILEAKKQFYSRVRTYLERCQNLKTSNPKYAAFDDGGFMYYPGNSKAGNSKSYGSMTYAGILSMIYSDIDKADPKVHAAHEWIRKNYSVTENPGMQAQGLFYYYHTMAKALTLYGEAEIIDTMNVKHNWASELANQFLKLQKTEGYWVNEQSKRWYEDNNILVTAYMVLSIEEILSGPGKTELIELN